MSGSETEALRFYYQTNPRFCSGCPHSKDGVCIYLTPNEDSVKTMKQAEIAGLGSYKLCPRGVSAELKIIERP